VKPLVDLYQYYAAQSNSLPPEELIHRQLDLVDYRQIVANHEAISFKRSGMQITLDGIAKGYIVDAGTKALKQYGFNDILVEAGGDLMAEGQCSTNNPWKIGVESPRRDRLGFIATFGLTSCAAATSGDYMQSFTADFSEHHILDPKRGHSPAELSSATVIAPTSALADALATGMMVLGVRDSLQLCKRSTTVQCLLVTKDGQVMRSADFPINA
jgi:thiamine biosynthesis lipoprotein